MADHTQMLRKLLADVAQEHNYKDATIAIHATSSGGANYTSVLYNITISSPDKKPLQLFAKVANITEKTREIVPTFIFDIERFIYRDLAEIFKKIEQQCEMPEEHRYVLPKFYGYNPNIYEETIVMEDLTVQGYMVYDRLKSVDWPYASKAAEAIAKFHALSIAYGEKCPLEYEKLCTRMSSQLEEAYIDISKNFNGFVDTAVAATRAENKDRLKHYFDKLVDGGSVFRFSEPNRRPVLIHGDYRPSNIMHKVKEDGSVDLIPLDYQTIRAGCGASDLLYFIVTGSDAEFRAKYYQKLVDHYYESLTLALRRLKLNPNKIYPREDFDYELQEALPHGLVCALFVLPIVTVDSEDAPDINGADVWENMAKPKTSSYYPDRLNGVIDDYIRWGVL